MFHCLALQYPRILWWLYAKRITSNVIFGERGLGVFPQKIFWINGIDSDTCRASFVKLGVTRKQQLQIPWMVAQLDNQTI